jgi:hypothetical protein
MTLKQKQISPLSSTMSQEEIIFDTQRDRWLVYVKTSDPLIQFNMLKQIYKMGLELINLRRKKELLYFKSQFFSKLYTRIINMAANDDRQRDH